MSGKGMLLGFILVALVIGLLGVRSGRTVVTVLDTRPLAAVSTVRAGVDSVIAKLGERNAQVASAEPTERDPFGAPPRPQAPARTSRQRAAVPRDPTLQAIIHHAEDATVRVKVGAASSDWLHVGDAFQGWTVDEISADAVRLSRNGRQLELQAR